MRSAATAALAGVALAAGVLAVAHVLPPSLARQLLALLLAFTSCAYVGAILAKRARRVIVGLELGVVVAVFGLAVLGLRGDRQWLALGFAVHGAWDLFHHQRRVAAKVVRWFPPFCSAFDLVLALGILASST